MFKSLKYVAIIKNLRRSMFSLNHPVNALKCFVYNDCIHFNLKYKMIIAVIVISGVF